METRDVIFKNLTEEQINAIKVLLGNACEIEKQKEIDEAEFPKYGDKYYFINEDEAWQSSWCNDVTDRERLSLGNCFETREEAEFEVERLKVLHEMKQFAEPKDYKWDSFNEHHYIFYRFLNLNTNNVVAIGHVNSCKSDEIYFESEEDAKACIESVGEDRIKKYYLRVEG